MIALVRGEITYLRICRIEDSIRVEERDEVLVMGVGTGSPFELMRWLWLALNIFFYVTLC